MSGLRNAHLFYSRKIIDRNKRSRFLYGSTEDAPGSIQLLCKLEPIDFQEVVSDVQNPPTRHVNSHKHW